MGTNDLRDWLQEIDKIGELKQIDGANWDQEIGTISILNGERRDSPALLFDNIKGYPRGYRVLTASLASRRRIELTLGLRATSSDMELVDAYRHKLQEWESKMDKFPYEVVKTGPVLENVHSGSDIDLFEFPVPKWHELDGGRYIGTADAVITQDPDTGEVNLGTYRVMVHDNKTTASYISPGKHGRIHRDKYRAMGKPCPFALVVGMHPLLCEPVAATELPPGSEYNYAGAIKGEPIRVIKEEVTGLPIPTDSEIVIAGWSPPDKTRAEGPFGEWTGYYASVQRAEPVIEVERIYHRNNPIMLGSQMFRGAGDGRLVSIIKGSALIWNALTKSGIPDVKGVWISEVGMHQLVIVSIKQRYPGHAKQTALLASQNRPAAYHGRYVIVVDEDIDPSNIQDVMFALITRSDPEKDIDILRRCWSTPLDSMIRKPTNAYFNSRAIIDACKPYEWIDEFPKEIEVNSEVAKRVKEKWGPLLGL